jgi:hypothetical protein
MTLVAVLVCAACGSEVTTTSNGPAGSGGGGQGAAGPGGGQGATGPGGSGAAPGATGTSIAVGPGPGTGGGPGQECGGFSGKGCQPHEYCDYPDDLCGGDDSPGVCKGKPGACPEIYSPTCACDNKVYGNACEAQAAGVDINDFGGCPAPKGMFECGHSFCAAGVAYCERTFSDVVGQPHSFACRPLPAACEPGLSCACLKGEPCGDGCQQVGPGALLVNCPGG